MKPNPTKESITERALCFAGRLPALSRSSKTVAAILLLAAASSVLGQPAFGDAGFGAGEHETILVSRASGADGDKGDDHSVAPPYPSVSADGRYVVFNSFATNLHPDDTDGTNDVFVRDLLTNETILVSRASGADGVKGNAHSQRPSISADGRYVAFDSDAANLHPDDADGTTDVFVRDLLTHETILVSRASGADGVKSNSLSFIPSISADGRYLAFISIATNLHPDADGQAHVFVRDLQTHETILASRATGADGDTGNGFSFPAAISADGRHVAFQSQATNLHPDDSDGVDDIFVRDLLTHETILASRAEGAAGDKGNGSSQNPSISADGRYIAFSSGATNLYPDDTNDTNDVFVRDLQTHETILASRTTGIDGDQGDRFSVFPAVSGDGRFVAFHSGATNLHPDDVDTTVDVYVRDLQLYQTTLVSRASGADGAKGNAVSQDSSISADGRFVVFSSPATNLHPDDTDGKWDVYMRSVPVSSAEAELTFDPTNLDFGDVDVGTTSPPLTTTLRNIGNGEVTGLVFDTPANGFAADTSDCGATLPAGGSCAIAVTFTPPDFGAFTSSLTATTDQDATATLALAGTGVGTPGAEFSFDPESLAFGEVEVGDSSPPQTATLQNTGTGAASGLTFFVMPNFTADASACGTNLGPGESCAVVINFTPLAPGAVGRELEVASAEGISITLPLTGTGVASAPHLVFSPDGFDFGEIAVGASSAAQTTMLQNTGNADATGLTFTAPLGGFDADTSACGDALPAGASCPVHVSFTPELPGLVGATLMVESAEGAVASLEGNTPDKHLYFLSSGFKSIFRMDPADIGSGRPLFTSDSEISGAIYGLEVDTTHCAYYWVPEHRQMLRAGIDGTGESVLFDTFGGGGLRDLAIDDAAGHLYFTRSQRIYRGDIGPDGLSNIVLLATTPEGRQAVAGGSNTIESMALDLVAGHIYWTGATGVWRADLDGSNVELVTDASSDAKPEGIGLDLQAGKVYWGDSEQNPNGDVRIHRANLDGTGYEVLIVQSSGSQIHGVRDLAVDADLGKIFWSMSNNEGLFRANLDGTEIEEIPQIATSVASALTFARGDIDALCGPPAADICPAGADCNAVESIYWAGGTTQHGELWRANADGSYRESIHTFTAPGSPRGVAVTRELGKVYWTQTRAQVYRADLDGSGVELMLQLPFTGVGDFTTNMAFDLSAGKMFIGQQRRDEFVGPNSTKATLWRANLDGSGLEVRMVLDDLEFGIMGGPQLDEQARTGYVIADDTIYRFALDDDSAPEVIVPSLPLDLYPDGEGWELEFSGLELQIDLLKGKLYWVQAFHNGITGVRARRSYRVNLDGTQLEALSWEPASTEWQGRRGLALDPRGGRMYGPGIFGDGMSRWEIEDGADLGLIHSSLPASPTADIDLLPAASGSNRAVLSMRGVGVAPGLTVEPGIIDFGAVQVGDVSGIETVTLTSTGNEPVEVTGISAAATPFERTGGDCPATPFELAPAAECTLRYSFAPTTLGTFEQGLTVESTADPVTFTLAGEGVPVPPTISVAPDSFAVTLVEDTADEAPLLIGNSGDETLNWNIETAEPAGDAITTWRASGNIPVTSKFVRGAGRVFEPAGDLMALGDAQMSQTGDTNVVPANSIACSGGPNHLLRRFYFNEHPGVGDPAEISSVDIGIQEGVASQTLTVNLYTVPADTPVDTIPLAALTPIGSGSVTISAADDGSIVNVPVSATVSNTAAFDLVVEATVANVFFIGATNTGETHPGFIMAPACGVESPERIASLGAPDTHIIMVVNAGGPTGCQLPSSIPWLSAEPAAGTTPSGGESTVQVGFDATGLAPGVHEALVCVNSNDPARPRVGVPVALTVTEAVPDIGVTPAAVDFGSVPLDTPSDARTVTLENTGTVTLSVSSISDPSDPFDHVGGSCTTPPFDLEPGESCTLEYTFTPTAEEAFNSIVTIGSNAASGTVGIALTGEGVPPPPDNVFHSRFQGVAP